MRSQIKKFTVPSSVLVGICKNVSFMSMLGLSSICLPTNALAAALPANTELRIIAGIGSAPDLACATGSCFGMEMAPGFTIWTDFGPGTDSGFIIGKNQKSGGQELAPSAGNITSGDLTSSWLFFGNYGTFYTDPSASQNIFDNASCAGTTCIGKTELKVWNTAWNKNIIPMGSFAGCSLPACTPDQQAGIFVTNYTIDPVTGGTWNMNYGQIVPSGQFQGVKYTLVLRGLHYPPPPCTASSDKSFASKGATVTLTGTCTFSAGTVSTIAWTQQSGPTAASSSESKSGVGATTATDTVSYTLPVDGTYVFTLTGTSSLAETDTQNITVSVKTAEVIQTSSNEGCSMIEGTTANPSERFDWLLVMAFIVWLGAISRRHRRQQVRI